MNQKILLAEALNILQRTRASELEVDCRQQQVVGNNKLRSELSNLCSLYERVGNDYLLGAEIINHVRRTVMGNDDVNSRRLTAFCEGKMEECMDRCEVVRAKKDNILLPLTQMGQHAPKEGFDLGDPVLLANGNSFTIKRSKPFERTVVLRDGSYVFWIKNLDSYSIAAPKVAVLLEFSTTLGTARRVQKVVPCQCGWKHVIGVIQPVTTRVVVSSDAVVRDSHVEVALYSLKEAPVQPDEKKELKLSEVSSVAGLAKVQGVADNDVAALTEHKVPNRTLPTGPEDRINTKSEKDITEELQSLKVPHVSSKESSAPVPPRPAQEIPQNMNCVQRLQQLQECLNAWPKDGVMAVTLGREQRHIIRSLYALPSPVEIDEGDET
ncbi:hypothetical protein, conserved [Trypanosoma brucei gambiense DAL972]|uniref:Uncharacterized protein n=1 Tax=Trypanosoma brucei gambiense (strain MHOM/CI/86/DAL972) TaxID=679716 RepID=C9ZTL3_TRYB9|nr:hypothetical protein, conserved [Trypanosoma brucei gambiense DAL972]CBH12748.1 hypothetical protein, conserved [Trypanosoma brucei gambiense DAL972]|eukprot:XP_011775028.1 hypothetical protein, conserved [Trypanosoma brucei gambiense DAL972]